MRHQINLLGASGPHRHAMPGSSAGLVVVAASLGLAMAAVMTVHLLDARAHAQADAAEHALTALQAKSAVSGVASSTEEADLTRLRGVEADQRRVRAALEQGIAEDKGGYSGYLLALSRQSAAGLWLTGFVVAPDGRSLEVLGRMTDPRQLPAYLHRLEAEPLFNGRKFEQLSLRTAEPGATATDGALAAGYLEFTLHAAAPAASGAR